MGIVQRQGIYSTIVIYIGIALGYINVLLFLELLTQAEYGLRNLLLDACIVVSYFALIGVPNSITRFYPEFEGADRKQDSGIVLYFLVFFVVFLSLSGCGFYFVSDLFFEQYVENSPQFVRYSYLVFPLVGAYGFNQVVAALLNAKRDTAFVAIIRELFIRLSTTALLFAYAESFIDLTGFLIGVVCSYGLAGVIMFLRGYHKRYFNLKWPKEKFRAPFLKKVLEYTAYAFLGASAGILVSKTDSLMIGSMVSQEGVAIYSFAFFMAAVIEVPKRGLGQVATAVLSKQISGGEWNEVNRLYKKVSINQQLGATVIYVFLICVGTELFMIIPKGSSYEEAGFLLVIIGATKVVSSAFSLNGEIIGFSKFYRMNLVFTLCLAVAAVALNYFFIQGWSLIGAAVATFLVIFSIHIVRYVFVRSKLRLSPFTKHNFILAGFSCLVFLALSKLGTIYNPYLSIALKGILVVITFGIYVLVFKPSEDLEVLLNKIYSFVRFSKNKD